MHLQTAVPRGNPLDQLDLAALGVSSALDDHYLKSGWLSRLGRGVFKFPNDILREQDCFRFLARRIPGLHIGGKTALAWRGVRLNLPAHKRLWLWGISKPGCPGGSLNGFALNIRRSICLTQRCPRISESNPYRKLPVEFWCQNAKEL